MIFSYYVGCYWYLFSFMSVGVHHHHDEEDEYVTADDSFVYHPGGWDLVN
jgi:hypothetical protein